MRTLALLASLAALTTACGSSSPGAEAPAAGDAGAATRDGGLEDDASGILDASEVRESAGDSGAPGDAHVDAYLDDGGITPFDAGSCPLSIVRPLNLPSDTANGTLTPGAPPPAACNPGSGPLTPTAADVYGLAVPTRTGVMLRATSSNADVAVEIRRQCDQAATALACGADPSIKLPPVLPRSGAVQTVLEPGDYFVVVELAPMGASTMFYQLGLSSFTPAGNAVCAGATPLADGTVLSSEDLARGSGPDLTCSSPASGMSPWDRRALFYSATIPAGDSLIVTTAPTFTFTSSLLLRTDCAASSCLATGASNPTFGANGFVEYVDTSATSESVVIDVIGDTYDSSGAFGLSAWIRPPPSNTTCATALAVSGSTTLTAQDAVRATQSAASACDSVATGNDLFYVVSVPAGQQLNTTMKTPYGPWPPALRLFSSCGATSCLDFSDPGEGHDAIASYRNTGSSAVDVVIAAGSRTAGAAYAGPFDLVVAIGR
jgi:hypothetical protein